MNLDFFTEYLDGVGDKLNKILFPDLSFYIGSEVAMLEGS